MCIVNCLYRVSKNMDVCVLKRRIKMEILKGYWLVKPNEWSYAIAKRNQNQNQNLKKNFTEKCNEAQKWTNMHELSKLSHSTTIAAMANCHTKCTLSISWNENVCSLVFLYLCVCIVLASAGCKPEKRFTETWQDPIFCCCLLLILFFSLNWLFYVHCTVYFRRALFSRKIHIDINFYCKIEIFILYIFIMCNAVFMSIFGAYIAQNTNKQTNMYK